MPGLLHLWMAISKPPGKAAFIFPAFSFAAAKRGEGQLSFEAFVSPDTYRKSLARWFGEALGLDVDTFLTRFGTKPG